MTTNTKKRLTMNVPVCASLHERMKNYHIETSITIKRIAEDAIRAHMDKIEGKNND